MRKNFPIKKSYFNENTGLSFVTIVTPEGEFTGMATIHPSDLEKHHYTSTAGQYIAHRRAFIQYLKYMKRLNMYAYTKMNQAWCTSKKHNVTSYQIKKNLEALEKEIQDERQAILDIQNAINLHIEDLDKYFSAKNK